LDGVVIGVIDIGTNTARLLVAEVAGGSLAPRIELRTFVEASDPTEIAAQIGGYADRARAGGAAEVLVVGTAGFRRSGRREQVAEACRALGTPEPRVLSPGDEARLAFLGATGCEPPPCEPPVAVADVGGGSTEIAIGAPPGGPGWWHSIPLGSRTLADRAELSDPPRTGELERAREIAAAAFAGLEPPPCRTRLAVGDASLRELCGEQLSRDVIAAGLARACASPSDTAELEIAPQRLRVLPAALIMLDGLGTLLGGPLRVAHGGVREGSALEWAAGLEQAGEAA
jgi:exopolyphosphatase / guanosine-5'-triphosphate,3'-diphosphate pyrophosphatase